jgi:uncharacterized tellurite resistance protein B-like protein|tara:strand:- start:104 stop:532 length:429 start_codon:yes stop_codon:yes gene_type:complete
MFKIFKNKKVDNNNDSKLLSKTTSLLIHAAKIDENYTIKEKEIIKKTLIQLGAEVSEIDKIMIKAEADEENSNQILDFTREVKNSNEDFKIKIVEALWYIIYSNNQADIYESSLMRRLSGLLYLDNKVMGDIKEKIKKKLTK